MYWLSIAERHSSSECVWRGMKWISYLFPPSFAQRFLAGLLCSSYVSHHYRANPSMTMFNFLWGIWSAVVKICNPMAHLSSINAVPTSLRAWALSVYLNWVLQFRNQAMLWYNLMLQTFFKKWYRPENQTTADKTVRICVNCTFWFQR